MATAPKQALAPAGAQDSGQDAADHVPARDGSRSRQRPVRQHGVVGAVRRHARCSAAHRCGDPAVARDRAADAARSTTASRWRWCAASCSTSPTSSNSRSNAMDRRNFLKVAASAPLVGAARRLHDAMSPGRPHLPAPDYRNLVVLDRAQGRQRRPEHGHPLCKPNLLCLASEARDCARPGRRVDRQRRPASSARAAVAVLEEQGACRAPRRRLSRAQPVALSLDRDLGHGLQQRAIPSGWLVDPHVQRGPDAAEFRRRRRASSDRPISVRWPAAARARSR